MKQDQALQILISAAQVATKRGAFELNETPIIAEAVAVFIPKEEPKPEGEEKPKKPKKGK